MRLLLSVYNNMHKIFHTYITLLPYKTIYPSAPLQDAQATNLFIWLKAFVNQSDT